MGSRENEESERERGDKKCRQKDGIPASGTIFHLAVGTGTHRHADRTEIDQQKRQESGNLEAEEGTKTREKE